MFQKLKLIKKSNSVFIMKTSITFELARKAALRKAEAALCDKGAKAAHALPLPTLRKVFVPKTGTYKKIKFSF